MKFQQACSALRMRDDDLPPASVMRGWPSRWVMRAFQTLCLLLAANVLVGQSLANASTSDQLMDLLSLESASDPRISPDGSRVAFKRWRVDWLKDNREGSLWLTEAGGDNGVELGAGRDAAWSPDSSHVAYFLDKPDGQTVLVLVAPEVPHQPQALASLAGHPRDIQWSPDGRLISFRMGVPASGADWTIDMPEPPTGANWAPPPHIIDKLHYRLDGLGYHYMGYEHLFVIDVDSRELRQVTQGNWHVGAKPAGFDLATSTSWSADSASIFFDGIASEDYEKIYGLSNVYRLDLKSTMVETVSLLRGFWINPSVSPDGSLIAFAGFEQGDSWQTYTTNELWVSRIDGSQPRKISADLDRDAQSLQWASDSSGVYFAADINGTRQAFFASVEAITRQVTQGSHALYLGNVSRGGRAVASLSLPGRPPEIVSFNVPDFARFDAITDLNGARLPEVGIASIEELLFRSADQTPLQGWLLKPAGFDPARQYPLILEIHGGPHEMYHWGWSTYFQGLAARGFLVLYSNPRGSSGYGTAFGNAIDNNFPGPKDFEDLMAAVSAVESRSYVDADNVFVTGCSAGGTLALWLIAHSDRFNAAAANCVISNFLSYAGTADVTAWSLRRFRLPFWENPYPWLEHSPLMKVGQINTPTLLMSGEQDLRTPIGQAEQMFSALKSREVPTRLVRFPTEAHGTTAAPSNMLRTILYITDWFDQWKKKETRVPEEPGGGISQPSSRP